MLDVFLKEQPHLKCLFDYVPRGDIETYVAEELKKKVPVENIYSGLKEKLDKARAEQSVELPPYQASLDEIRMQLESEGINDIFLRQDDEGKVIARVSRSYAKAGKLALENMELQRKVDLLASETEDRKLRLVEAKDETKKMKEYSERFLTSVYANFFRRGKNFVVDGLRRLYKVKEREAEAGEAAKKATAEKERLEAEGSRLEAEKKQLNALSQQLGERESAVSAAEKKLPKEGKIIFRMEQNVARGIAQRDKTFGQYVASTKDGLAEIRVNPSELSSFMEKYRLQLAEQAAA